MPSDPQAWHTSTAAGGCRGKVGPGLGPFSGGFLHEKVEENKERLSSLYPPLPPVPMGAPVGGIRAFSTRQEARSSQTIGGPAGTSSP